jgi:hypothetical protein
VSSASATRRLPLTLQPASHALRASLSAPQKIASQNLFSGSLKLVGVFFYPSSVPLNVHVKRILIEARLHGQKKSCSMFLSIADEEIGVRLIEGLPFYSCIIVLAFFLFMYYHSASARSAGLTPSLVDQSKVFSCLKNKLFCCQYTTKQEQKIMTIFFTSQMAKSPLRDVCKAIVNAQHF